MGHTFLVAVFAIIVGRAFLIELASRRTGCLLILARTAFLGKNSLLDSKVFHGPSKFSRIPSRFLKAAAALG
jgi:hypothetical protein